MWVPHCSSPHLQPAVLSSAAVHMVVHPLHMLSVAGVFGGPVIPAMHASSAVHSTPAVSQHVRQHIELAANSMILLSCRPCLQCPAET